MGSRRQSVRTEFRTQRDFFFRPGLPLKYIPLSTSSVFPQTLYWILKMRAPRTPELFHFVTANPDENIQNCKSQAKLPRALGTRNLPSAAGTGSSYLLAEYNKTSLTSGGLPKCCDRTTKLIRVSGWPLSWKQEQSPDPSDVPLPWLSVTTSTVLQEQVLPNL